MTVRKIIRDQIFLSQKSIRATPVDKKIAEDLLDTLKASKDRAIGLAANMIGESKNIIAVFVGPLTMVMFNPKIIKKSKQYEAEEGCLSLDGVRKTKRYEEIEVIFEDEKGEKHQASYSGIVSEAIQHEVDHCKGKII